jgi:hypothetical protein
MKSVIIAVVLSGTAYAQNSGPAPQAGMEKPGMTNGAREDGKMDTQGMGAAKGNVKRERDGAPANDLKNQKR